MRADWADLVLAGHEERGDLDDPGIFRAAVPARRPRT